jgi:hypothetical protein
VPDSAPFSSCPSDTPSLNSRTVPQADQVTAGVVFLAEDETAQAGRGFPLPWEDRDVPILPLGQSVPTRRTRPLRSLPVLVSRIGQARAVRTSGLPPGREGSHPA